LPHERRLEVRNAALAVGLALLFTGCARVYVQPAIDLRPHEVVGIIEFKTDARGDLAEFVTQKFIQSVTEDQTEIKIVELGDEKAVLEAVGLTHLGPDAFKAIGEKYDLSTVFTGNLDVTEATPSCAFGPGYGSIEAKVNARLSARLVETNGGGTIWSNSARDERTVAGVEKFGHDFSFTAEDPEKAYGDMARSLCRRITHDFRHTTREKCL
jgi:hypothetical protein